MNKRLTDRGTSFKKIKFVYRSEIPDDLFNKYCMIYRISRNDAVDDFKEVAGKAVDNAINMLLLEVQDVKIYDNRE